MIQITRITLEHLIDCLYTYQDQYQFMLTDFQSEVRLKTLAYDAKPWYQRIFSRAPSYDRLKRQNKQLVKLDELTKIQLKLIDMDDWETQYCPEDHDPFFISEADFEVLKQHIPGIADKQKTQAGWSFNHVRT